MQISGINLIFCVMVNAQIGDNPNIPAFIFLAAAERVMFAAADAIMDSVVEKIDLYTQQPPTAELRAGNHEQVDRLIGDLEKSCRSQRSNESAVRTAYFGGEIRVIFPCSHIEFRVYNILYLCTISSCDHISLCLNQLQKVSRTP